MGLINCKYANCDKCKRAILIRKTKSNCLNCPKGKEIIYSNKLLCKPDKCSNCYNKK